MSVKTDANVAIAFLKRWAPTDRWVLTAISTDKKNIVTKTFAADMDKAALDFVKEQNDKLQRNLYFHVNPVTRDLSKKAEREDISEVSALHVDVDPRAGESLTAERERILGLFTDKLPLGVPEPSVIIYSGGGYQAFWFLDNPIPIDGKLDRAEDAKRYNQQLEMLFGGDNCHNIDRIMRLPGTVNWPDAKKKAKGREPVLAELIKFDEMLYPLGSFVQAPLIAEGGKGFGNAGSGVKVEVTPTANVARIMDLSELDRWKVPDRVKVIIAQGRHPDEPRKDDDSRSEWLFDAVCNLVRAEVPDEVIFSIITDKDWEISASVLDKKGADKYAIRQIQRAKEHAIDPNLVELNDKHAVIENFGGKCVVIEEIEDHALGDRTRLTKQSFSDFRNRYNNKKVQAGTTAQGAPIMKEKGKWWLEHPQRRQYKQVVFVPGREVNGSYNLWKGFAVEARPSDKHEMFLELARDIICSGIEEHYTYLLGWMARLVQTPATAGETSVVMRGGQGIGKGQFMRHLGKLFGRHYLQISDSKHLVGNFNAHLRDCLLLFADEAFFAGDKKHESVLKTLITERHLAIEAKGVDVEQAANFVHVMMASNNEWVVPAGADERRYFVVDVSAKKQGDSAWFGKLSEEMANGGYEALLHFLLSYDLTGFNVREVPKTRALQDQKMLSLGSIEEWWHQKLDDGRFFDDNEAWEGEVIKDHLFKNYTHYQQQIASYRRVNQTGFWSWIRKHVGGHQFQRTVVTQVHSDNGFPIDKTLKPYFWSFPSLEECRKKWESRYGAENWTQVVSVQEKLPVGRKTEVPF